MKTNKKMWLGAVLLLSVLTALAAVPGVFSTLAADSAVIGTIVSNYMSVNAAPSGGVVGSTSAGYTGWGKNGTGDMDFIAANNGTSPSIYWYYLLGSSTLTPEMWLDQSAALHVPGGISANVATATALASTPTQCAGPISGIASSGNGNCLYSSHFQIEVDTFTVGLPAATAATAYASSSTTMTWPTPFFDGNYGLQCSYAGVSGVITGVSPSSFTSTGFTVTIWNGTGSGAVASSIGQLSCTATHP